MPRAAADSASTPGIRFPPGILQQVLALPGNSRCFDCARELLLPSEVFGLIPHGTVLCRTCAEKLLAALPDRLPRTAVRSLHMDCFSARQVLAMRIGGNKQLKGFFERQRIDRTPPELLYTLRATAFYRRQLALEVDRRVTSGGGSSAAAPGQPKGVADPEARLRVDANARSRVSTGWTPLEPPSLLILSLTHTFS